MGEPRGSSAGVAPGSRRPGGRTARVRDAVFQATVVELGQSGYATLSLDAVAARAGVHKTTIYRRWRSRDRLVAAALHELAGQQLAIRDTGDIDRDLRGLARSVAQILSHPTGAAAVQAIVAAGGPSAPNALAPRFWASRLQAVSPLIERAIQAGQLPPAATDPSQVIAAIAAPLYFRLLVSAEPLTQTAADTAAAAALVVARDGLFAT
jgi:AcrR family transcriptional regulator